MTRRAPFVLACVLLGQLLACAVHAQGPALIGAEPRVAPWVQVELVLFRQLDTATAGNETWPTPGPLSYPEPIRILLEPGSPAHAAALAAREFDAVLAAEENTAAQPAPEEELPFLLLDGADTLLGPSAARLAGSSQYRLLGHLAWRQPLPAPGSPVAVLVTAGARTGSHHELEGYIRLSRARYLHADATLWLNDFPASGSAPEGVPLPEVPLPVLPAPQPESTLLPADPGAGTQPLAGDPAAMSGELQVEPMRALRTVVLRASRRLAPGEFHYVDHPLFGMLVAVRPWDPAAGAAQDPNAVPALPPAGAEETPPPP